MSAGAGYEGSTQKKGVMGASAARQSSMILSPAFSTADGSFSSPGKGSSPCPAPCWELRDRVSGPANTVSIRRRGSSPSQDAQSSETVTAVPVAWHGAGQGRVPLRERRRREKQTKETGAKEYTGVRQRSEVCKRVRPILAAKTRNKKKQQVHKTKLRGERHAEEGTDVSPIKQGATARPTRARFDRTACFRQTLGVRLSVRPKPVPCYFLFFHS